MAPAFSIEKVSQELKSTASFIETKSKNRDKAPHLVKGRWAEDQALSYFIDRGFVLWARNFRTPFAEVDLVFEKDDVLMLVEVKFLSDWEQIPHRVHPRQLARFKRASTFLLNELGYSELQICWAFVLKNGQVFIIDDGY